MDKKFLDEFIKDFDLKPYQKAYISMLYYTYKYNVHPRLYFGRRMSK